MEHFNTFDLDIKMPITDETKLNLDSLNYISTVLQMFICSFCLILIFLNTMEFCIDPLASGYKNRVYELEQEIDNMKKMLNNAEEENDELHDEIDRLKNTMENAKEILSVSSNSEELDSESDTNSTDRKRRKVDA